MISLDTNVLVRIIVDDPGASEQCAAARAAVEPESMVHISQVVQAELSWVLSKAFKFRRAEVRIALLHLRDNVAFHLEQPDAFAAALDRFNECAVGFADCLILGQARSAGASLLTFDKKLARLDGARGLV